MDNIYKHAKESHIYLRWAMLAFTLFNATIGQF
jgi:hypothetical protein